jgi:hypothetical protein
VESGKKEEGRRKMRQWEEGRVERGKKGVQEKRNNGNSFGKI